jgi:hypothetical protein
MSAVLGAVGQSPSPASTAYEPKILVTGTMRVPGSRAGRLLDGFRRRWVGGRSIRPCRRVDLSGADERSRRESGREPLARR